MLTGAPVWAGWAVVVAVTFLLVGSGGGMRSITSVQAVQFWVKLAAVAVSAAALLGAWHLHGAPTPSATARRGSTGRRASTCAPTSR